MKIDDEIRIRRALEVINKKYKKFEKLEKKNKLTPTEEEEFLSMIAEEMGKEKEEVKKLLDKIHSKNR